MGYPGGREPRTGLESGRAVGRRARRLTHALGIRACRGSSALRVRGLPGRRRRPSRSLRAGQRRGRAGSGARVRNGEELQGPPWARQPAGGHRGRGGPPLRRRGRREDQVKALLSFFTVLPVRAASLDEAARETYLLPLVGIVTGLPGAFLLVTVSYIPPGVASTLALGAALVAAGLHHADGVLDVGDALMVRGSTERRRAVLEDARVGIGGIGALFLVYAPAVSALTAVGTASPVRAALVLLAGEVAARSAMVLTLAYGK